MKAFHACRFIFLLSSLFLLVGPGRLSAQSLCPAGQFNAGANAANLAVTPLLSGTANTVAMNGAIFFPGYTSAHGTQLWITNGTAQCTEMLTNGNGIVGIHPNSLVVMGNLVYFSADDLVHSGQLWKSDGTVAGTLMVTNVSNGIFPTSLTNVNGTLFFLGFDPVYSTSQIFKSDGTATGTVMVTHINETGVGLQPTNLVAFGSQLLFRALDAQGVATQLWITNGVTTTMLTTGDVANGGTVPQFITSAGSLAFFSGFDAVYSTQLWVTNGTVAGTTRITSGTTGAAKFGPTNLTALNNTLFFAASDGVHGQQLWQSNGTASGTKMVTSLNSTTPLGLNPIYLTPVGSTLFFTGLDTLNRTQIWISNGTASGTTMVGNLGGTADAFPNQLIPIGNTVYFAALSNLKFQVWSTNGSTVSVLTENPNASMPAYFTPLGTNLFFMQAGADFWILSPTSSPTPTTSATLVKLDSTTQGNWIPTYGSEGYNLIGNATKYPSYVTVTPAGESSYTWIGSTTDPRALKNVGGSGAKASCWYAGAGFSVNVNLTDGQTHHLALYVLDWDNLGRSEQIQFTNATTGAVLDTETVSSFYGGIYLQWAVTGNVVITVKNLHGTNAVLSGLFLDAT